MTHKQDVLRRNRAGTHNIERMIGQGVVKAVVKTYIDLREGRQDEACRLRRAQGRRNKGNIGRNFSLLHKTADVLRRDDARRRQRALPVIKTRKSLGMAEKAKRLHVFLVTLKTDRLYPVFTGVVMSDRHTKENERAAVIDIGSNAVRLVIYDSLDRTPFRTHNERVVCNLGAFDQKTGCLNRSSADRAIKAIGRYASLLRAMNIGNVSAVATAAIRDARDGADFIARIEKEFDFMVKTVGGEEEARLSALGVLGNGTGGDGVIGDYGGGSLELVAFKNHAITDKASLPIGSHRLTAETGIEAQKAAVEKHLETVHFLHDMQGSDFYALGGAWRSMGKAHMHTSSHPVLLLDHYTVDGKKMLEFTGMVARQDGATLERTPGLSKKRIGEIGVSALAMKALLEKLSPRRIVFSVTGLREGLLFDQLSAETRQKDALISSCEKIAGREGKRMNTKDLHLLADWMMPLFVKQDEGIKILVRASCLLSGTEWLGDEEYRADLARARILAMPFYGVDHSGRAFLALSQYVRHRGHLPRGAGTGGREALSLLRLLGKETIALAEEVGIAQRLGYLLTGGALSLLRQIELSVEGKRLSLLFRKGAETLKGDLVLDALQSLAEMRGMEPSITA